MSNQTLTIKSSSDAQDAKKGKEHEAKKELTPFSLATFSQVYRDIPKAKKDIYNNWRCLKQNEVYL